MTILQKKLVFITAYLISLVFCLSAALNDGVSEYWLGVPFLGFILILSIHFKKRLLLIPIIPLIFLAFTLSKNSILYPQINQSYTLNQDIVVYLSNQKFCTGTTEGYVYVEPGIAEQMKKEKFYTCLEKERVIPKGSVLIAYRIFTEHPDFGIKYSMAFKEPDSNELIYLPEKKMADFSAYTGWKQIKKHPLLSLNALMYYPMAPFLLFSSFQY